MALPSDLNTRWFQAFTTDSGGSPALNVVLVGGTVAGPLLFPDGTQALPSIAFASEPTLGFRRTGAGGLAFQSAGATTGLTLAVGASNILTITQTENTTSALTNMNGAGFWTAAAGSGGYALGGLNGNRGAIMYLTESTTLAGATTASTIQFPAASIGFAATIRITTTVTGCTTIDFGVAGTATRYGTLIPLTANTTNISSGTTNPSIYSAATSALFTAVGGGASFTGGVVRTTLFYWVPAAPTS